MTARAYLQTSIIFTVVCVGSAVIASSPALTGGGYDGLGRAMSVTVFITIPAFAIALTAGLAAGFMALRSRRRP